MKASNFFKRTVFLAITAILTASVGFTAFSFSDLERASVITRPVDPPKGDGIDIDGKIPALTGLSDKTLETGLNESITAVVNEKIRAAKKESARGVSFSYEEYISGNTASVIVFTQTTIASSKTEADSFNFDLKLNKMVNINDVLGINAVPIANIFIRDTIKRDTEKYNADFGGITDTRTFYVEGDECVLVFDKYEIASGYEGVIRLAIPLDSVTNTTLARSEYVVWPEYYKLKMIPVRKVCEKLGYEVLWNENTRAITLTKESRSVTIDIGKNEYQNDVVLRSLEAAPTLIDGVTYAPIAFFEIILGAAYTVDETERVTFSIYSPA
ncbi:MAG: DUF3298 domain-containing protein [Clostridiales bacterium]|jgi:hypothetical protein|nr:DUF3298 domain-containing protein [Clostridiales bacterium]